MQIDNLSDVQRSIYDLLVKGKEPAAIAERLNSTEALVRANMTRIRNKGVALPGDDGYSAAVPPPNTVPVKEILSKPESKPASSGGTQNDQIAAMLNQAGKGIDAKELAALADKVAGKAVRDIHPMILLGITIQYVKTCGGRMVAHQVIEDVYGALRSFVGGALPADDGGEAVPLPKTDKDRLSFLEEQNTQLLDQIRDLQAKLRSQNPSLVGSN